MRWRGLLGLILAFTLLASAELLPLRGLAQEQPSLAGEAAKLLPAVVAIKTTATTPEGRMYFDGSGFIVDPAGYVVTNRHVIAGAYEIHVYVPGVGKLVGKPVYISPLIDLALLKVDADKPLPAVMLGDSDKVQIGDRVMLIGNPLGVGESVSLGVVSALNRDIGETMFDHFIQTDAALNHGNSGGAMFNMAGEVIGIDTGLTSSPGNTGSIGIGYAMPINDAKFALEQLRRTGTVVTGWVGVQAQKVTDDLATGFGMSKAEGAIITWVDPRGPAAGKLMPGDIVLKVNDQDATDTRAAARIVATTPPGQPITMTLRRNGAEQVVTVMVGQHTYKATTGLSYLGRPPEQMKMSATPSDPGMGLSAIDEALRRQNGLDADQAGVMVTSVNPQGVAAERKIVVGDIILSVSGKPVNTPAEVKDGLRAVADKHVEFAPLLVRSLRLP